MIQAVVYRNWVNYGHKINFLKDAIDAEISQGHQEKSSNGKSPTTF